MNQSWTAIHVEYVYKSGLPHRLFNKISTSHVERADKTTGILYMGGILKNRDGIPLQIGGTADHVHVLAKLSPKHAVMDVLRDLKADSSKWINDERFSNQRFEWQAGYGAFSVSGSQIDSVRSYIQNQEEHHKKLTFREEFLAFLRKHQIEFDLKYVFDEELIA